MEGQQPSEGSPLSQFALGKIFKEGCISLQINAQYDISCSLYFQDYESMLPFKWLRTQAIVILLKILQEKCLAEICKIYASSGVIAQEEHRQYVKILDAFVATMIMTIEDQPILQSLAPLELFSQRTKCLLIPINTELAKGSHWLLACFLNGSFLGAKGDNQLIIFDSGQSGMGIAMNLKNKLQKLHKIVEGSQIEITLLRAENIPYQTNSYDCGIYTIGYGQYIMKELVRQLQEGLELVRLDRLNSEYKYMLGNSKLTRERYRRMLEDALRTATQ